jgi:hypothetical protein
MTLPTEAKVVNVGLALFADAVRDQGTPVENVDWRVPGGGDPAVVAALRRLYGAASERVERANAEVVRRLDSGVPLLRDVAPAAEVVPDLDDRTILHCGPAIGWAQMCDPLRRSVRAAVVAEGWAEDVASADRLLARGDVRLRPANLHAVVVPMASAVGPSAPVHVVEGPATAFAPVGQGSGDVAWFGRDTPGAVARLTFLREVAGPRLRAVVRRAGPVDVLALAAQALQMGDDVHLRTQAGTNLLIRTLLPHLVEVGGGALARFLSGNHLFFLTLAMAAAKSLVMSAEQVADASVVTTMARNGTTFGVRLAGCERWSVTEAPPVADALYHPGQGPQTSARDIGDSAVLELIGLGGAAAGGCPAVAALLGGAMREARAVTEHMDLICAARSSRFTLPTMDSRGTPLAVDVRRVAELGVTPKMDTGILHAGDGSGQVGAGVATAPQACFLDALLELDRRLRA